MEIVLLMNPGPDFVCSRVKIEVLKAEHSGGNMYRVSRNLNRFIIVACILIIAACAHQPASIDPRPPVKDAQVGDHRVLGVLAGEWDYIDSSGAVVPLKLDAQGNGHYEWKDGHFETRKLVDHTWSGIWVQEENDREGGFKVEFSPDFSEGEGQWWYNRIGDDKAPSLKGGTFHLRSTNSG
jgi:hypothetical protein